MIPTNPPPTFRRPELWSDNFMDFVKQCLIKSPEQRATATQLLQVGIALRGGLSPFHSHAAQRMLLTHLEMVKKHKTFLASREV